MTFLRPIIIGAFAFFTLSLNAQTQPAPNNAATAQYSQANINRIATELSLTSDQVAQIELLNAKVIQKIEAIQNDAQMTDSRKREFIRGNGEDHKRVMSTILTSDQFNDYLELMKGKASNQTNERKQMQDIKKTH